MTKDLQKHSRKLDCRLPLKKNSNGNDILPKAKANYFMMSPKEIELCQKEINDLLSLNLISPSSSPFSCHAMYVPKYDENGQELPKKRLVVNYKPLNACLQDHQHPLPSKDYIWQTIQGSHIYSKFDLTKGFWQISIHPNDRDKTAFFVPQGLYEWNVLPFGIKTAPSIFQQHMDIIFHKYSKFILPYIDDSLVFSQNPQAHPAHLRQFLALCQQHGLAVNPTKSQFFQDSIIYIGIHLLPRGRMEAQQHILTRIANLQVSSIKEL
ncbi:hypothetical protein SUGI_0557610 [Cryptomeria japonica]|nr:hypothetical protein SUGI_0557610 [Cryptomeria japonica]